MTDEPNLEPETDNVSVRAFRTRVASMQQALDLKDGTEYGITPELDASLGWAARKMASQIERFPKLGLREMLTPRVAKALEGF